jgi:hypothetical protein
MRDKETRKPAAYVKKVYVCVICAGNFNPSGGTSKTCSDDCSRIHRNKKARENRANKPEVYQAIKANHRSRNRDRINRQQSDYYAAYKNDPVWVVRNRIKASISKRLRLGGEKSGTFDMLGYRPQDLADHLERQFLEGMGWRNRSDWHIDHIVPISTARTVDDVIALNQLSNLRPLWAGDNMQKSASREYLI